MHKVHCLLKQGIGMRRRTCEAYTVPILNPISSMLTFCAMLLCSPWHSTYTVRRFSETCHE